MERPPFPYPADFTAENCRFLAWESLTGEACRRVNDAIDLWVEKDISRSFSRTLAAPLPFYPGVELVAVTFAQSKRDHFCLVRGDDLLVWLDSSNEPIYRVNEILPIRLTREIVPAYVRFFFHFVRRHETAFDIVETLDDIAWHETASTLTKENIATQLMPLTYFGLDKSGFFRLTGTVLFRDALFRTDILAAARHTIGPPEEDADEQSPFETGMTALTNEILLAEDLPVRPWLRDNGAAGNKSGEAWPAPE